MAIPLDEWKIVIWENAISRFPQLTKEEFGEAARFVIDTAIHKELSLKDFADKLLIELQRKHNAK